MFVLNKIMTSLSDLSTIAVLFLGGYLVYEALTYTAGQPYADPIPENAEFYGNDNMTFFQGLHTNNKVDNLKVKEVGPGLALVNIGNGVYELDSYEGMKEVLRDLPQPVYNESF